MKKTYIVTTATSVRVEAESETEAEELASLEMDIGDIDWEAEEVNNLNLEYPLFACEETAQIEAMWARHLSKDENKNN